MRDTRAEPAKFYDLNPNLPRDVPFYIDRLPRPRAHVLELGCGTGRVAIPLAAHCASVHGLDQSEAMVRIAREKVASASLGDRISIDVRDISCFELRQRFDFIVAPFRVLQNLEFDAQVDGLFQCIRRHLEPRGRCIVNTFNPNLDRDEMRSGWVSREEKLAWEVSTPEGRVVCYDRRFRIDPERLVLYPELVYRRFHGDETVEEAILPLAMRCYYPDDLTSAIESRGFRVLEKWGGYEGEEYGKGGELVVEFCVEE
jgi:ubiquinone/menaquinone biosynthesis C-methylase UbiE